MYWTYQIAEAGDITGRECQRHSDYYCLWDWYQSGLSSNTNDQDADMETIWDLASKIYKKINWFNLGQFGGDFDNGCCGWQSKLYMIRGRMHGYSPQEFIDVVSDMDEGNKVLASVSARFDHIGCVNVIDRLEYGTLVHNVFFTQLANTSSTHMDRPFVVISNDGGNLHLVGLNLQQTVRTVTFRWFKQNIVCEEHPEFCETRLEAEMNQMRIN
ncbi:uncharacterized protein LOC142356586 [Convolutriloba macropyga]|uniref:uncharacterized protein LOC142356586 n=1 Tax=Convolutriloba macropyga TaxID=536237 RepID=UPI003F523A96